MLKITVSCLYLDSAGQVKEKYLPSLVQVCLASLLCQSFFCVLHLHVITHRLLVASSRALRALLYVLLRCWVFSPRSWISVSDFQMLHIFVAVLLFPLDALLVSIYRVVLNFPQFFFFFFFFLKYLQQTVVLVFLLVLPSKIASVLPNISLPIYVQLSMHSASQFYIFKAGIVLLCLYVTERDSEVMQLIIPFR